MKPRSLGLRRLARDAATATAAAVADRLTRGEHTRRLARCHELAEAMSVDVETVANLRAQLTDRDDAIAALEHRRRETVATHTTALAHAQGRHQRAERQIDDVWTELRDHGHGELMKRALTAHTSPAAAIAEALEAPVPEGSDITDRLAHAVWSWTQLGGKPGLFESECREIAYVLAPVVSAWLRDAALTSSSGATP